MNTSKDVVKSLRKMLRRRENRKRKTFRIFAYRSVKTGEFFGNVLCISPDFSLDYLCGNVLRACMNDRKFLFDFDVYEIGTFCLVDGSFRNIRPRLIIRHDKLESFVNELNKNGKLYEFCN